MVVPSDLFSWAALISSQGSNVDEVAIRAAVSRAYYGAYFTFAEPLRVACIGLNLGRHERIVHISMHHAVKLLSPSDRDIVRPVVRAIDAMRVRRGDADYELGLKKADIISLLGLQIYEGKKALTTAATAGKLVANAGVANAVWLA